MSKPWPLLLLLLSEVANAFDVPMIRHVVTNIEARAVIERVVFHFLVVIDIAFSCPLYSTFDLIDYVRAFAFALNASVLKVLGKSICIFL